MTQGLSPAAFAAAISQRLGYLDLRGEVIEAYEAGVADVPASILVVALMMAPTVQKIVADVFGL